MGSKIVVYIIIVIIGFLIYRRRPNLFFFYWISIQPFFLALYFFLFPVPPSDSDTFYTIYFGCATPMLRLMFILILFELFSDIALFDKLRILIKPLFILVAYLFIRNFLDGFEMKAFVLNITDVFYIIIPFVLLLINENCRPSKDTFVKFAIFFIAVQFFFCVINICGFRFYDSIFSGRFEDHLIAGTFLRYNHMTNYLTTLFYILSFEFFERKTIEKREFILLTIIVGCLIGFSGARMSLILFSFTLFFYFVVLSRRNAIVPIAIIAVLFWGWNNLAHNDSFYREKGDDGTGLERNVIGIVNLANTDDISEEGTLSLSGYLFLKEYNNPIWGNGYSYKSNNKYDVGEFLNEEFFRTDARLTFMLVEYGLVGFSLFAYLFFILFMNSYKQSYVNRKMFYIGAAIYFILFSVTDDGIFDKVQLSLLFIYAFSRNVNSMCDNEEKAEITSTIS